MNEDNEIEVSTRQCTEDRFHGIGVAKSSKWLKHEGEKVDYC